MRRKNEWATPQLLQRKECLPQAAQEHRSYAPQLAPKFGRSKVQGYRRFFPQLAPKFELEDGPQLARRCDVVPIPEPHDVQICFASKRLMNLKSCFGARCKDADLFCSLEVDQFCVLFGIVSTICSTVRCRTCPLPPGSKSRTARISRTVSYSSNRTTRRTPNTTSTTSHPSFCTTVSRTSSKPIPKCLRAALAGAPPPLVQTARRLAHQPPGGTSPGAAPCNSSRLPPCPGRPLAPWGRMALEPQVMERDGCTVASRTFVSQLSSKIDISNISSQDSGTTKRRKGVSQDTSHSPYTFQST